MRYFAALTALSLIFIASLTERAEAVASKIPTNGTGIGLTNKLGGSVLVSISKEHIYDAGNFKGYSATPSDAQTAALRWDPNVAYIESDKQAHTNRVRQTQASSQSGQFVTQASSPCGPGRLSHREKGSTDYLYHSSAGEGTYSYIVHTDVDSSHPEFKGRAELVQNFVNDATTDDNGHNTHVAGPIVYLSQGVVRKTKLYDVKVLDADSYRSWSTVIAGVTSAEDHSRTSHCPNGAVINMSLGGQRSQTFNDAAAANYDDASAFIAVVTGNEGQNTNAYSPSSEPKAFTVGATDKTDNITYYSKYGILVDSFAPGDAINSTWLGNKYQIDSGTSMAAPHIVGLAAKFLGFFGKMDPEELGYTIKAYLNKDVVGAIFPNTGTPNFWSFNGMAEK